MDLDAIGGIWGKSQSAQSAFIGLKSVSIGKIYEKAVDISIYL